MTYDEIIQERQQLRDTITDEKGKLYPDKGLIRRTKKKIPHPRMVFNVYRS